MKHINKLIELIKKSILYLLNLFIKLISSKKNEILVISHDMSISGGPIMLLNLCKIMSSRYNVSVWTLKHGKFELEFIKNGFPVKIINRNHFTSKELSTLAKYKLVICNTIDTYIQFNICRTLVPTIWYIHESDVMFLWDDEICKKLLKESKNIICVSDRAKSILKEKFKNDNVIVVYNYVDDVYEKFNKTKQTFNNKIRLLSLGTINDNKNYLHVLNSIESLPLQYKNKIEYYIAGPIFDLKYYANLRDKINKCNFAHYIGAIKSKRKKYKLINSSDAIVIPSKSESCSLVILESLMMNKMILMSKYAGDKTMISNNNGIMFDIKNIDDLKSCLMRLIDGTLKLISQNSRKIYLNNFSKKAFTKKINLILKDFYNNKTKLESTISL